jgi:DNA adenine methylase
MQYFGGKFKIATKIAELINGHRPTIYLEPFCGSCNVGVLVHAQHKIFCDLNPKLIAMWQVLMNGWLPPTTVTETEYRDAQNGQAPDYLIGFIGFACSFSGKYFGGYARNARGDNFARNGSNSLVRKAKALSGSEFYCIDYRQSLHSHCNLVYCDPPYTGTTKYYGLPDMDYTCFWDTVRTKSETVPVLVSEYTAPQDFKVRLQIQTKLEIRNKNGNREPRIENVYSL